jgi:chromosome segregation ATPase
VEYPHLEQAVSAFVADYLAAIIQSQTETKAKFDEDYNNKKADAEAELKATQELVKTMKEEAEQEIEDAKNEAADIAKKKSEEDEYNFKRERQIKLDKVDDEIKEKWKVHKANVEQEKDDLKVKSKELDEREEDLAKKEDRLEELESKVEAFPDELVQAKEQAAKDAIAKEGKSHAIEIAALKREAENKDKYHEIQIQSLEEKNRDLAEKNETLQDKLDEAYTRIQQMAIEQSKANSSSKAFDMATKLQNGKDK